MSRVYPTGYLPGVPGVSRSRADDRYRQAVQRNIDSALRQCRLHKGASCYSVEVLMKEVSLSNARARLGVRPRDQSWDLDIQQLRCAILAAWALYRWPEKEAPKRILEVPEFASMEGGERRWWLSRLQEGLSVLEGKPSISFGAGFYGWD